MAEKSSFVSFSMVSIKPDFAEAHSNLRLAVRRSTLSLPQTGRRVLWTNWIVNRHGRLLAAPGFELNLITPTNKTWIFDFKSIETDDIQQPCFDPEHWRSRAKEARAIADQMTDADSRSAMLRIADDYDRLPKEPHSERPVVRQNSGSYGVPSAPVP
jgi:hypothetical protein